MKIIWIVFVILCILLFTYLFVYVNNPITNIEFYYCDDTLDNGRDAVCAIQKIYSFYSIYAIYVVKTYVKPTKNSNYFLSMYVQREGDYYLVVLISRRFNLQTLLSDDDGTLRLVFSDRIINFYVFTYHKFIISLGRELNGDINLNGCMSQPMMKNDLYPSVWYFTNVGGNLMRFYVLKFRSDEEGSRR